MHRSGFVALVGRPNVGKSALLNRLIGSRVAPVSAVPQTTRTVVRGVLTLPEAQIVFLDTPGVHNPRHRLGEFMVTEARKVLTDVDLIAWMVDASAGVRDDDRAVAQRLRAVRAPKVLVVNKVDLADAAQIAEAMEQVRALLPDLAEVFPVSSASGLGVAEFVAGLVARLPEGPAYYPEDMLTDQPEQSIVRELIREQISRHTRDEVPHAAAVEIEEFAERPDGTTYVRATIHVERASQKKILIGAEGRMLKTIGTAARREAETVLGRKVYLDLWVAVTPDWREKRALIRQFHPDQFRDG